MSRVEGHMEDDFKRQSEFLMEYFEVDLYSRI